MLNSTTFVHIALIINSGCFCKRISILQVLTNNVTINCKRFSIVHKVKKKNSKVTLCWLSNFQLLQCCVNGQFLKRITILQVLTNNLALNTFVDLWSILNVKVCILSYRGAKGGNKENSWRGLQLSHTQFQVSSFCICVTLRHILGQLFSTSQGTYTEVTGLSLARILLIS